MRVLWIEFGQAGGKIVDSLIGKNNKVDPISWTVLEQC